MFFFVQKLQGVDVFSSSVHISSHQKVAEPAGGGQSLTKTSQFVCSLVKHISLYQQFQSWGELDSFDQNLTPMIRTLKHGVFEMTY